MKGYFNKKGKNVFFWGALIIYAILLIYTTYKINISEDETYTLNTTSRDLAGIINQSYNFEAQPPGYFILFSWWQNIYHGIFFAKMFSIFLIGLSAYFFYRLVLLISGSEFSKWMVLIFLLNPFTVWAALNMRTYALLIFLSTISIYYFFRFYLENRKYFLYVFLFISFIGMYTQYFFTYITAALAFTILIFKGWRPFFRFCLYLIPLVLLFLPNLKFIPNQIDLQELHEDQRFNLTMIVTILHTPQELMLGISHVPNIWINRLVRIIFFLPVLYAYIKIYKKQNLFQSTSFLGKYNMFLISVFTFMPLFCLSFVLTGVIYADNYLVVVFPFLIILFTILRNYSSIVSNLLYGSLSIYFIILLTIHYRHPVKTYDFISTADYIKKIELPGEPILTYRPGIALPLSYYYTGKNRIVPIPRPVKFDTSYLVNIKDTVELRQSIESINTTSTSYLLVSDRTIYESKLNMNRTMVDDYLKTHYNIILDTLYYGMSETRPLRIRRFQVKSQ